MTKKSIIPEGLWTKCDACASVLFKAELDRNVGVCPKCDHHHRLGARRRIAIFLDDTIKEELGKHFEPTDRFKFKDTKKYKDRLVQAQKQTGEKDALVVMRGTVCGIPVMVAAFDFNFIGGSMGAVVGERFVLAAETALASGIPFICFATSGGARMQESLVSLMQMAKTTAALRRLHEAGIPYLSVMLDPCMGGVSASLAMLGDINIAEPKALIGFSGPRVIQQTIRQTLPEGFQRSEFLLERGFVDLIIHRCDMKFKIACLLAKMLHLPEPPQPVAVKAKDKATTKREAIDE